MCIVNKSYAHGHQYWPAPLLCSCMGAEVPTLTAQMCQGTPKEASPAMHISASGNPSPWPTRQTITGDKRKTILLQHMQSWARCAEERKSASPQVFCCCAATQT
jgi:hypothetical protein